MGVPREHLPISQVLKACVLSKENCVDIVQKILKEQYALRFFDYLDVIKVFLTADCDQEAMDIFFTIPFQNLHSSHSIFIVLKG